MSGFQRLNIVRKTGFVAGVAALAMIAVSFSGGPLVAASCRTDAMGWCPSRARAAKAPTSRDRWARKGRWSARRALQRRE